MADLHDLRTKVPTRTLSVIQALEMATGQSGAEITREWLVERAEKEAHKAILISRVLGVQGSAGDAEGK
jgi:hypothetical protein